jgi:protein-disulfide isomerase
MSRDGALGREGAADGPLTPLLSRHRACAAGGRTRRGRAFAWGLVAALVAVGCASGNARRGTWGGGGGSQRLPGVDSSDLTSRESSEWWAAVNELLAPCPDQAVSVAQCVAEARPCASCRPAADLLVRQVLLGRPRTQVEAAFRLRFDPAGIHAVDAGDSPWKGAKNPVVVIVEWADFECPFCARAAPMLSAQVAAHPDQVRLVFKHFPLDQHVSSRDAALAAVAAQRQGKFWELHDALYAHRDALDAASIARIADDLGLDMDRFQADIASPEVAAVIDRDMHQADELGLRGTPLIYINGREFALSVFDLASELEPWIEDELELATGRRARSRPRRAHATDGEGTSPRAQETTR